MKSKLIHILALPTAYMFWQYVNGWVGMKLGYGLISIRPYVYRALVNWIVQGLMLCKIPQDVAYIIVMGFSLVGTIITFATLYRLFRSDGNEWAASYISSWILLLLLYKYPKPYDLMTVFLMTLGLIFIYKNQHLNFAILFPFLCMNRETAFLLTIVCAVWFWRKMRVSHWMYMTLYQGIMFVLIQSIIRIMYRDRESMYYGIRAYDNLKLWVSSPVSSLLVVLSFLVIAYILFRNWNTLPKFLRVSFLSMFPVLLILYVCFGYGYELRVFAEVYPILFILLYPKEVSHVKESKALPTMQGNSKGYVS